MVCQCSHDTLLPHQIFCVPELFLYYEEGEDLFLSMDSNSKKENRVALCILYWAYLVSSNHNLQ